MFDDLLKERYKNSVTQLEKTKAAIEEIEKAYAVFLTKDEASTTINALVNIEKTPENIRSLFEVLVDKIIVKKRMFSLTSVFRLNVGGEPFRIVCTHSLDKFRHKNRNRHNS